MGCINYGLLWCMYTLATEVNLHLGGTGLCFIVKGLVGDINR